MNVSDLMFWKRKSAPGEGGATRRRVREYGYVYGMMKDMVRVPQLGLVDLMWIAGLLLLSNAFMVISLFKFYMSMEDYSHAVLVPAIAAAAAWRVYTHADEKPEVRPQFWGLPIVTFGLLIQFVSMWYEIGLVAGGVVSEYFTSVGLVITVWGLFISFFGFRALAVFWFPLLYLVFLIPGLPGPPEQWLKGVLRNFVTVVSAGTLELFGYTVYVEKNLLEIPGVKLGVADACSGIRSLWAMLAVAPAVAWFMRLRPFLIALFLPLGVFLAIFQNIIRVVATAMLCDWFGMQWASGTRHDVVGGVSFFLSSIIMVILARVLAPPPLEKKESYGAYGNYGVYGSYGVSSGYGYGGAKGAAYHAANDMPDEDDDVKVPEEAAVQREFFFQRVSGIRALVFLLLFAMLLGQLALFQKYAIRNKVQLRIAENRLPLDAFPRDVGPYRRIYWGELPEEAVRILQPSETYVAHYVSPNNRLLHVIINFWRPVIGFNGNSWAFPHSPDVCFRESGFQIVDEPDVPPDLSDPHEIMYSRMYSNQRSQQMVLYWYNQDRVAGMMNEFIDADLNEEEKTTGKITSIYLNRLRHMVRSWSHPKEYSRFQYSVGVYVPKQGTDEETIALAQDFSRELRRHLPQFGLQPLQNMNLDSLDGLEGFQQLNDESPGDPPPAAPPETASLGDA